jgi:hypothetical protein
MKIDRSEMVAESQMCKALAGREEVKLGLSMEKVYGPPNAGAVGLQMATIVDHSSSQEPLSTRLESYSVLHLLVNKYLLSAHRAPKTSLVQE